MPAQSITTREPLYTYGQFDTYPPLDHPLRDPQGNVIDLTGATAVYFSMGWAPSSVWKRGRLKIIDQPCQIGIDQDRPLTEGWVRYNWKVGELDTVGLYIFSFRIVWAATDEVQTVKSLSYEYINVQAGPGTGHSDIAVEV